MAYKDPFNLKKRKKKPSRSKASSSWPGKAKGEPPPRHHFDEGVWKKDMAPPEKMIYKHPHGGPMESIKGTDPRLRGRKAAHGRGSRVVKPRPMKGVPRNLPPEIDPKYKKKAPTKPKKKSTPIGKIGVRTGASGLSKLVKAMNK
tara:strand:- start:11 stop:445 length:435 start_codon:yes stop_codon:yes gene_type:complete